MLSAKLLAAYPADEIKRRLLKRRRFEVVVPELGPCWVWDGASTRGYGLITLSRYRKTPMRVHRLAAALWGDLMLDGPLLVRHRCHNPSCFRPDHVLTGTARDNARDMTRAGRHGERKLSESDAAAIRLRYTAGGSSYRELALLYGVSPGMIAHVVRGRRWPSETRAA
jgi:hypothetical protein